ncbi:MAG: sarcosine oxidase subunit gamma [Steroidobacteraceae bacterium]
MLEHQQPFESVRESLGGNLVDEPGLRSTPWNTGLLLLQSARPSSLEDALTSEIGLELPTPQQSSARGDHALLWLTPAEWLLAIPSTRTDSLQSALTRRLATSLATVIDVSDAFASCEVTGARAAETLMSGCSLDLRALAFPSGRVARTALASIPAILWNPGGEPHRLRCLIDRSFAGHLREWLVDAAQIRRES